MTDIKLSVQEALDIIQKVSHLPTTHLLAQRVDDALHKPVGPTTPHNGYKEIAKALRMPANGLISKSLIEDAARKLCQENDDLSRFKRVVTKSADLNPSDSLAQVGITMAYRKTVTDAANKLAEESDLDGAQYLINMYDRIKSQEGSGAAPWLSIAAAPESLPNGYKEIAKALGLESEAPTLNCIVEAAIKLRESNDITMAILKEVNEKAGLPGEIRSNNLITTVSYMKKVTEAVHEVASENGTNMDGAQYVFKMRDALKLGDESTRRAIASAVGMEWMADITIDSLVANITEVKDKWRGDARRRLTVESKFDRIRKVLMGAVTPEDKLASKVWEILQDGY